jgi:1,4-alpha-glucan branching enzyme
MGILTSQTIDEILKNNLHDPFEVFGMHWESQGISVRAFAPEAASIDIMEPGSDGVVCAMNRVREEGVFEAVMPQRKEFFGARAIPTAFFPS